MTGGEGTERQREIKKGNASSRRILRPMKPCIGKICDAEEARRAQKFSLFIARAGREFEGGQATGNHPRLYRNRIYNRPSLSVRRPQRTPQRGIVVNNEYASVFVYSGSTQRYPHSIDRPPPSLPPLWYLRRPTPPPCTRATVVNCNTVDRRLLFTTPQLANPKASIRHT